MMKRFKIIGLCLVAAFAVSAVVASGASAHLYGTCAVGTPETKPPCNTGEKFTPFPFNEPVHVVSRGTTSFLLLTESTPVKGIECQLLLNLGFVTNLLVGSEEIGHSEDALDFQTCTPISLAGCTEINPKMNHEILGNVVDEISKNGKGIKITVLPSQFNVKCVIAGTETELGNVTGSAEGTVSGDKLVFTKGKGLTFFEVKSTITGTNLTETLAGKPVFVD